MEARKKMESTDIEYVIFQYEMDLLWIIEIKDQKNPEMNTSKKIFKLTGQIISIYISIKT